MWSGVAGIVAVVLYEGLMLRFKGQTVGMVSLRIGVRLADAEGQLPWSTIARRLVGKLWPSLFCLGAFVPVLLGVGVLVGGLYGLLDVLWPLGDRRNQTLHDKVAGTVVVVRRR